MARLGHHPRFDQPLFHPAHLVTCDDCGEEMRADDLAYHAGSPACAPVRGNPVAPECESCGALVNVAGAWCDRCNGAA